MSDTFNLETNTNVLIGSLRKSIDEVKNNQAGIATRSGKKDENSDVKPILHEDIFNILSSAVKDMVELVHSVRLEMTEQINTGRQSLYW